MPSFCLEIMLLSIFGIKIPFNKLIAGWLFPLLFLFKCIYQEKIKSWQTYIGFLCVYVC